MVVNIPRREPARPDTALDRSTQNCLGSNHSKKKLNLNLIKPLDLITREWKYRTQRDIK